MTDTTSLTSRRTILTGAAAVGAGGLLAACGGDSPSTAPAPAATTASPTATPTPTPTATPSPTASSAAPVDGLVAAADVPVGGGTILKAEELVVTQPTEGEFKAFSAVCTHQQCIVAKVESAEIVCACHNSRFSIEDGSVLNGPATSPLPETAVAVEGGQVVQA